MPELPQPLRLPLHLRQCRTRWVPESIFQWFVVERKKIQWIVRKLNRLRAPKDHRSSTSKWYRNNVLSILNNAKFLGIWPWGQTKVVRDPNTGIKRQEPRPAEEYEEFLWIRKDLAFIDPQIFAQAQQMLKENQGQVANQRGNDGTLRGSSKGHFGRSNDHLLQGLILCPDCQEAFYSGGSKGRFILFCNKGRNGACPCSQQLNRDLAERLILKKISETLIENPAAQEKILQQTIAAWEADGHSAPDSSERIAREIEKLKSRITRLLDELEERENPDIRKRLDERRQQLRTLEVQRDAAQAKQSACPARPDADWVKQQLQDVAGLLREQPEVASYHLQQMIPGKVSLSIEQHPRLKRPFYRGTFTLQINLLPTVGDVEFASDKPSTFEFDVDFLEGDESRKSEMQEARRLYEEGWLNVEIAKQLKCCKAKVTNLLKASFAAEGREMPDGRARRSQLPQKQREIPLYQRIADQAVAEWEKGQSFCEIGRICGCDDVTAQKAIGFSYESRGLPVPTAESRRQQQQALAYQRCENHVPLKDIARELCISMTTLRAWLKAAYEAAGKSMPDGRTRRWQSSGNDPSDSTSTEE